MREWPQRPPKESCGPILSPAVIEGDIVENKKAITKIKVKARATFHLQVTLGFLPR